MDTTAEQGMERFVDLKTELEAAGEIEVRMLLTITDAEGNRADYPPAEAAPIPPVPPVQITAHDGEPCSECGFPLPNGGGCRVCINCGSQDNACGVT